MLVGLNTNVATPEGVLHVQTEDLGLQSAAIVTHVFGPRGNVVKVEQYDYRPHLGNPRLQELLRQALQKRHESVIKKLRGDAGAETTPEPTLELDQALAPGQSPDSGAESPGNAPPAECDWDHAVLRAQQASLARRVPWDDIVRSRREEGESPHRPEGAEAASEIPLSERDGDPDEVAREAYLEGRDHVRRRDLASALSKLALAVHLKPACDEYRKNLLRILIRLD